MVKRISILSDIIKSVLLALFFSPFKRSLKHVKIVKTCMNGITLLGHISAEFRKKKKNNLRNIGHTEFVTLFGQKQGSAASKVKPKNSPSVFLNGDNLKSVAKENERSEKNTRKDSFRAIQRIQRSLQSVQ